MALTKADFAAQLLDELGLSKPIAKELVELFFEEIKATLEHAESVKLSGFGKFELLNESSPWQSLNFKHYGRQVSAIM